MKVCKSCGMLNRDDSRFCTGCGSTELEFTESQPAPQMPPPPPQGIQPPPPPQCIQPPPPPTQAAPQVAPQVQQVAPQVQPMPHIRKPEFTMFDLCTIFGFVASIVGIFQLALILDPLALIASIIGFSKGKRNRGLAVAGVVIAAIGLLVRLFITLYDNGVIPKWVITGVAN